MSGDYECPCLKTTRRYLYCHWCDAIVVASGHTRMKAPVANLRGGMTVNQHLNRLRRLFQEGVLAEPSAEVGVVNVMATRP